jgi:hypothetical protein
MATIIHKKQGKKTYYYYQETYRVKINKNHSGKKPGSGKSRVCTRRIYLGPAEHIMKSIKEKRKPISLEIHNFGLIAAAYQVAEQIGLIKILRKHIQGKQSKVHRWIYFFVTIINRLDHATSKNKMRKWLQKTILPQLLSFDANKFTSKNFWYATDDIISDKEIRKRRRKENENEKESESESENVAPNTNTNTNDADDDLMEGIGDDTFNAIESELFHLIDGLMGLSPHVVCYDTTNFYTYIDEPARSQLAKACHSKNSKHHLKHIGLLMAVEKSYGIPLISRVYRANSHDSKLFSFILADLIIALKKICQCDSDPQLVLVLDKGNNSQDNYFDWHQFLTSSFDTPKSIRCK